MLNALFSFTALLVALPAVAPAQALSLPQLIAIRAQGDLPAVNNYLLEKGWKFDAAIPEPEKDQVQWLRQQSLNGRLATAALNIFFCNSRFNYYCDQPALHKSSSVRVQHAYLVYYQPAFLAELAPLHQQALDLGMKASATLADQTLSTTYIDTFFELKVEQGRTRYQAMLMQYIPEPLIPLPR